MRVIDDVFDRYASRVGTGELNRILRDILATREAPLVRGRRLKIYYGAQVQARPPRFRLTVNDRSRVTRDYAYWLENQLREALALQGVPVILTWSSAERAGARRRRRLVGTASCRRAATPGTHRRASPAAIAQAVAELAAAREPRYLPGIRLGDGATRCCSTSSAVARRPI
jgi:hypothetical protein